jgi:tetratricopeptide (TPR) repeat protein
MLKNKINTSLFLTALIFLASCGSTKNISNQKNDSKVTNSEMRSKAEYNDFFAAEKERIKGNKSKARKLYREFVKKYKTNGAAYYNLSRLEFATFNFTDAENYAARAAELYPKNKYYLELYADVLSLNKKPKKAIGIYENLAKLFKGSSDTYRYKMYKLYAELKEYKKAYETLESLEANWGISPEISMQKVELLLKQKKGEEAVNEVQKLIAEEPSNPDYKEKLASLYDRLGKKEKAKEVYEQLIADAPNNAKLLMQSSTYYLRNNDTVGFQKVIKKIVSNPKIDKEIRMSMLLPLIELNKDSLYIQNEILPMVKSMKMEDEKDSETNKLYADILYSAGQYKEAANAYSKYLETDRSKFAVWFNLMLCHSSLNQLDSVISVAESSFDYFPNNAFTHYFKGTAHYQKKEFKSSISSLQSAIELEPNRDLKAQIFSMMGDAHHSLEEYQEADKNFDASLRIKEDASTLNNYAYYLSLRNERLEDALKMSGRSLQLMPDTKVFLDTYGWILYKQGNYKKAKGYIEKAIEGEGDADVLEHLGDIYYKLNEPQKAQDYWQRAKKVGGGGSDQLDKKIQNGTLYE